MGNKAFIMDSAGRKGRGRVRGLALADFDNCRMLQGVEAVPSCLVPGRGVDTAAGQAENGPECQSPVEEGVGNTRSELVGLALKASLAEELFAISRNELVLGGAVSPRLQDVKASKYRK